MWETWVPSLCWEDPLEEGMATHSSILAWRIPMDRGAWRAIVHGVTKRQTRISTAQVVTEHQIWAPCIIQQISTGYLILQMVIYTFSREQGSLTQSTNETLTGTATMLSVPWQAGLHWASHLPSPSPHCSTQRRIPAGGRGTAVLCGPSTGPHRPLHLWL